MTERYYPTIDEASLLPFKLVLQQMADFPDYLSAEDCPFSAEVRDFFTNFGEKSAENASGEVKTGAFFGSDADKWASIEAETAKIYADLTKFGDRLRDTSASERIQVFKTRTALLDKLVSINERAMGLRRLSEFQTAVLDVIERVLNPTQRNDVMRMLREKAGQGVEDVPLEEISDE